MKPIERPDRPDFEQFLKVLREHIDTLAPGGGYLLGSGNCIADYMPVENYRAMPDEGLRYGR
jgi:hypothetical protein